MRLSDLQTGQRAVIIKVYGHGGFRKRIMEMGFVSGKLVSVLLNAPLKDPIKYKIMDYEVSLRRSEAAMIEVVAESEAGTRFESEMLGTTIEEHIDRIVRRHGKRIHIALVGNPNSGKTSLFNAASGGHEHVGNYSGVTVDAKRGEFVYKDYRFIIYDLPGTYALSAYTPEEVYVRRHLVEQTPDVVVNVVAASNLERNLYLTTELIDMNPKLVVALNMYDELQHSGGTFDYKCLGDMLGVPFVPTVARTREGLHELFDTVIDVYENRDASVRHIHINHGEVIEEGIRALSAELKSHEETVPNFPPRYLAVKMLEGDREVEHLLGPQPWYDRLKEVRDREVQRIEKQLGEDVETAVTNEKYGFISGALKETFTPGCNDEVKTTRIIDSFVTHKLFGFPIFILLMWVMFEATFTLGQYPMDWMESGVEWLKQTVQGWMSPGPLKDLLVDGIIGGVGGVIVFLPNILILYLFISFMEDSGYMARAAFIMDKVMHRIGLHGKSFIPLIMGFGCNVPAIMACRTIESRSSRIITVFINPFMSCSARLPVYLLLVGIFFPSRASLVLTGLYLLGIVAAVVTARIMRRHMFAEDETPFVMELPPYRLPTWRSTLIHMWNKAGQYLRKMGGVILIASIVIWFLSYYPNGGEAAGGAAADMSESYLGRIGHAVQPVMAPLGFDWKASVALLTGTAAKETIVSTLGVLSAEQNFTPQSALAFLVFVLLYFPCLATLAAIRNETGSWRWVLLSVVYTTLVAWIVSFAVFKAGILIG
ncbi:MAG: ferrous iron transport protein B [Rikenellaceae bacterium]|nr:ferrous iron transport protein B [Rikenellaceae bacterium]